MLQTFHLVQGFCGKFHHKLSVWKNSFIIPWRCAKKSSLESVGLCLSSSLILHDHSNDLNHHTGLQCCTLPSSVFRLDPLSNIRSLWGHSHRWREHWRQWSDMRPVLHAGPPIYGHTPEEPRVFLGTKSRAGHLQRGIYLLHWRGWLGRKRSPWEPLQYNPTQQCGHCINCILSEWSQWQCYLC